MSAGALVIKMMLYSEKEEEHRISHAIAEGAEGKICDLPIKDHQVNDRRRPARIKKENDVTL